MVLVLGENPKSSSERKLENPNQSDVRYAIEVALPDQECNYLS
jgi:hypothetical protein